MLPTHAMIGLALATPLVAVAPELAPVGLAGGLFGGIFPDLDLYTGHRKTLHFPTVYLLAVLPAAGGAVLVPQPAAVGFAFFIFGAAAHCQMDRYGGGLELRPWEGTSDQAVYDHVRRRWRRPKRWVPYDGSPQDLLLLATVGVPLLVILDTPFRAVVAMGLLIGGLYVGLRRRLAAIAPTIFGYVPDRLGQYVPNRYRH